MTIDLEVAGQRFRASVSEAGGAAGGRVAVRLIRLDGEAGRPDALDRQFDVQRTPDGCVLLESGTGRVVDAGLREDADGRWIVHLAGVDIEALVNNRRGSATESAAGSGEQLVRAPMPGRVLKILVDRGMTVAAGQPLVVIEAMKMENALTAVRPGSVEEIAVEEGMSVEAGRLLIALR